MPAPPDASFFDSLTPTQQILLNAAFFLVTAAGMALGYFKRPSRLASSTNDVMLTAASITDMKPVRDLVEATKEIAVQQKRTADALNAIQAILHNRAESEDISRRVQDAVDHRIRETEHRQR